jgi:hypothetical protein
MVWKNADVRARDGERVGDGIGGERVAGQMQEEGVDLRDGPIEAPARSHLPPVEDELLLDGRHRTSV